MTRFTAVSLAAFAIAGGVRGADPTIEDVRKAWKARQEANKSFRIEWVEKVKVKAGAYDRTKGAPLGPHPPRDHEYTAAGSLAADGDRVAATEERSIYYPKDKEWQPHLRASRFDGRDALVLSPLARPGWGHVRVEKGTKQLGLGLHPSTLEPIRHLYRPAGGGVLPAFEFGRYALAARPAKIGGTECVELALKEAKPPGGHSLWCDPARGFLPVRSRERFAGGGGYDIDWSYRKDDEGRWVPTGWEFKYLAGGSVGTVVTAEVKKLELGCTLAAGAFATTPAPPAWVTVYEDGDQKEEYLLRPDGSKRPLKRAEYGKDFNELIKTNADGTPYVPAKK